VRLLDIGAWFRFALVEAGALVLRMMIVGRLVRPVGITLARTGYRIGAGEAGRKCQLLGHSDEDSIQVGGPRIAGEPGAKQATADRRYGGNDQVRGSMEQDSHGCYRITFCVTNIITAM
jgi:hypothetical protein